MKNKIDLNTKDIFTNNSHLSEEELNKLKDDLRLLLKGSMKNFINENNFNS